MLSKYFILFGTYYNKPKASPGIITETRKGWNCLCDLNSITSQLGNDYYDSPDKLVTTLLHAGFVELPEKAFNLATTRDWWLYGYRAYVNNQEFIDALEWSSVYDGAPTIQYENPITPAEEAILDAAMRQSVSARDNTYHPRALIFPTFNNVVASETDQRQLRPWWDPVACAGRQVPAQISALQLEEFAPLMERINPNQSKCMLGHLANEVDN